MKVNSINNQSFGKIHVSPKANKELTKHVAYGIGSESFSNFAEKYKMCDRVEGFDINVNTNGAVVVNKKAGTVENFTTDQVEECPNVLYHLLNAAMNHTLTVASGMFKE